MCSCPLLSISSRLLPCRVCEMLLSPQAPFPSCLDLVVITANNAWRAIWLPAVFHSASRVRRIGIHNLHIVEPASWRTASCKLIFCLPCGLQQLIYDSQHDRLLWQWLSWSSQHSMLSWDVAGLWMLGAQQLDYIMMFALHMGQDHAPVELRYILV